MINTITLVLMQVLMPDKNPSTDQIYVTHLGGSGFMIETVEHLIVIDYPFPAFEEVEKYVFTKLDQYAEERKRCIIIYSHEPSPLFTEVLSRWKHPRNLFFYGWLIMSYEGSIGIADNQVTTVYDISICGHLNENGSMSFDLQLPYLTLYHGGSLVKIGRRGESKNGKILKDVSEKYSPIDLVFVAADELVYANTMKYKHLFLISNEGVIYSTKNESKRLPLSIGKPITIPYTIKNDK